MRLQRNGPRLWKRTGLLSGYWLREKLGLQSLRVFGADTTFQAGWGALIGYVTALAAGISLQQFVKLSALGWLDVLLLSTPQAMAWTLWRRVWGIRHSQTV